MEILLTPPMRQPDRDPLDKLLLDALVGAGLLLDDSERGLEAVTAGKWLQVVLRAGNLNR